MAGATAAHARESIEAEAGKQAEKVDTKEARTQPRGRRAGMEAVERQQRVENRLGPDDPDLRRERAAAAQRGEGRKVCLNQVFDLENRRPGANRTTSETRPTQVVLPVQHDERLTG